MNTVMFKGTEMRFEELLESFKELNIEIVKISEYQYRDSGSEAVSEATYLVDCVAMRSETRAAPSALAINDDVYLYLTGKKENLGKIEKIVQEHFDKDK